MDKISKEDMPELMPIKRSRMTMLRGRLEELEVGAGVFLPRSEWNAKSTPRYIVLAIKKKSGRTFEWGFKTDGSGWLFKRTL